MQEDITNKKKQKTVQYDDRLLRESNVYDREYILELNRTSEKLLFDSDYINELFIFFYLRISKFEKIFASNEFNKSKVVGGRKSWQVLTAAKKQNIRIRALLSFDYNLKNGALIIVSVLLLFLTSLSMPMLALLKITMRRKHSNNDFAVIRSPASYSKLKFLQMEKSVKFYYDDLFKVKVSESSLYSTVSFLEKVFSLLVIPILSFIDFVKLSKDAARMFGFSSIGYVQFHYALKVTHKCMYEYYLSKVAVNHQGSTYFTAHKEDRFAVVDMKVCEKRSMKSICVPHGVEYAFYVPTGLPGDSFYCTTNIAAEHLNKLYSVNKFKFDKEIAGKMFSVNKVASNSKKVVFFTEALGTAVNLKIISFLVDSGFNFYVKLHPKDNRSNYVKFSGRFEYLDDFDEAISSKICLARKSTVLVEALYNNSTPIAVLVDEMDRSYVNFLIPSLRESGILHVKSTDKLYEILNELKSSV